MSGDSRLGEKWDGMRDMSSRTHKWGDEGDDDEAAPRARTGYAWWKRVLVWPPAVIGVAIMLLGLIQLLPLLPLLVARDDGALGAGPAMFLIVLGAAVFGIALLIRWALGALDQRRAQSPHR